LYVREPTDRPESMHNIARVSRALACVAFDETIHAATASSGVRLSLSGFAMMLSIHILKEKIPPSAGVVGRARAGAKAREARRV
jgi:hypothetical protein